MHNLCNTCGHFGTLLCLVSWKVAWYDPGGAWMRSNSRPSGARKAISFDCGESLGLASYIRERARRSRTETHRAAACRCGTAMGQKMDQCAP